MRRFAPLCAVALVLGGCGGSRRTDGQTVFRHSCSGCHTLTGHDTSVSGGDLAQGKTMSVAAIASFARVMPVHLNRAEIQAVAAYVHAVAAQKAG